MTRQAFDCYRDAPDDRDWLDVVELADTLGIPIVELRAFLMLEFEAELVQPDAPIGDGKPFQRLAGELLEAA